MQIRRTLMGDVWLIKLLKRFPADQRDAQGVTYQQKKIILLQLKELSLSTIMHELAHALFSYQLIESAADLSNSAHEEVLAEFVSRYSAKLLNEAICILLLVLDKHKLEISDEDRALIGDMYLLQDSLSILGERLGFSDARGEEV